MRYKMISKIKLYLYYIKKAISKKYNKYKLKTGTKSILFGVHQFIWHPITVYLAWIYVYKQIPNFKETICIIIHDLGYWGKSNMDCEDGQKHPELGAKIALKLLDKGKSKKYYNLCLYHSRHYSKNKKHKPSKLCWADKMSIKFEPCVVYITKAKLSGELEEYRENSKEFCSIDKSNKEWYIFIKAYLIKLAIKQRANAVPYMETK